MKITYFEMHGLKRLIKRNIHTITYTPKHDIQVIIGSNGSGKTSLLKELSPLPAKSVDYHKDGYKIVHIDSTHGHCVLSSHFSPKQKHSFILNNEELNPGGTYPIQKELVKRYFRLDDKIQKMLLGRIDFTRMRSEEKKEWFTLLNPTSLSYPLQVYAKLKESYRDINGALKLHKNRLMAEVAKCIEDSEEKRLRIELDESKRILHSLFEEKPQLTQTHSQVNQVITQSSDVLTRLVIEYQSILKKNRGNQYLQNFTPQEHLESEKLQLTVNIQTNKREITEAYQEINKLNDLKQTLEGTNGKDLGHVEVERVMVKQSITELRKELDPSIGMTNDTRHVDQLISMIDQIESPLLTLLVELPPNPNKHYNSTYLTQLESAYKQRAIHIETLKDSLFKTNCLLEEDERMRQHNLTQCPQCNHTWVRDYNEVQHKQRAKMVEELQKQIQSEIEIHEQTSKELEAVRYYAKIFLDYKRFIHTYPQLSDFWSYVDKTNIVYENPSQISQCIRHYRGVLDTQAKYHALQSKLEELDILQGKLKETQSENITQINTRIEVLNDTLFKLNAKQHRLLMQLGHLEQYMDMLGKFNTLSSRIDESNQNRANAYKEQMKLIHRDMINHLIQETQLHITDVETQLSRIHSQKEIVAHIKKEINALEEKEQYLKLALQSMSPVDGLIAKGLYGFINTFIAQMNNFISKIWLTPLEIMPITVNEDNEIELDYVFSAKIHDGVVPDINECSKGEAEIINRAFILVAMHYLGMSGYPLYLDEFAANMDPKHKDSAFHAIVHLMGNSQFSQLFVVSHFEKFYSSLRNSDTIVFCSENVYIPDTLKYNQVITFTDNTIEGIHDV